MYRTRKVLDEFLEALDVDAKVNVDAVPEEGRFHSLRCRRMVHLVGPRIGELDFKAGGNALRMMRLGVW